MSADCHHGRRLRRRAPQVETLMQDKMRAVTDGLPLPPGLKLF
jgi:hypothetical protein